MLSILSALICSGCATFDELPISENGSPLTFQVTSVLVTRDSQYALAKTEIRDTGTSPMGNFYRSQSGNLTYIGPPETVYEQIPLQFSDSFVIVKFCISGISRSSLLSVDDVQLVDGNGAIHKTIGYNAATGHWDRQWLPFNTIRLSHSANHEMWIFSVPTTAVAGSAIKFQDFSYQLKK